MVESANNFGRLEEVITRIWETLPPVWHIVRRNVRGYASDDYGLTVEQFYVLRHIRRGVRTARELATARGISSSAISQSVEVLVEKNLISRSSNPSDRRYVYLDLTEKGSQALNDIFQKNHAWMNQKLAALSENEIETVLQAMNILNKNFNNEVNE